MSPSPAKPTPANATKNASEPTKPLETKPVAETKAAVEPQATETHAIETQTAPTASDGGKSSEKTIISLSVPEKLARQIRLVAKLEGVTISRLVLASVEKEIPGRLKAALAALEE
jgi:hypothetical protein